MTNTKFKIVTGCAMAVVLMMILSAIPISAEDSGNEEPLEAQDVVRGGEQKGGDKWSWDPINFVLTLEDGLCFKSFNIYDANSLPGEERIKPTTIVIHGTVTTPSEQGGVYMIQSNVKGGDMVICGGGTLISNDFVFTSPWLYSGEVFTMRLDNINMKIKSSSVGINSTSYDMEIINCKMIDITASGAAIHSNKKLLIDNTNLKLSNNFGTDLIRGFEGISLPATPVGDIVFLDINGNPTDGLTDETAYISLKEPGAGYLELQSYNEESSNDFAMKAVIIFCGVLAVVTILSAMYSKK